MAEPEYPAVRGDYCPMHTGEMLRDDVLPALGRPKAEIARLLGISRRQLYDIEQRKPISPAVTVRIGKLLGNGARIWIRMQADHDVWHAERSVDISKIPTITKAA